MLSGAGVIAEHWRTRAVRYLMLSRYLQLERPA
jgi:hypothetical protein